MRIFDVRPVEAYTLREEAAPIKAEETVYDIVVPGFALGAREAGLVAYLLVHGICVVGIETRGFACRDTFQAWIVIVVEDVVAAAFHGGRRTRAIYGERWGAGEVSFQGTPCCVISW